MVHGIQFIITAQFSWFAAARLDGLVVGLCINANTRANRMINIYNMGLALSIRTTETHSHLNTEMRPQSTLCVYIAYTTFINECAQSRTPRGNTRSSPRQQQHKQPYNINRLVEKHTHWPNRNPLHACYRRVAAAAIATCMNARGAAERTKSVHDQSGHTAHCNFARGGTPAVMHFVRMTIRHSFQT